MQKSIQNAVFPHSLCLGITNLLFTERVLKFIKMFNLLLEENVNRTNSLMFPLSFIIA